MVTRLFFWQAFFICIAFLFSGQVIYAQKSEQNVKDWCATDEVTERYKQNRPAFKNARAKKEKQITHFIRNLREEGMVDEFLRNRNMRIQIPVVFHVVYNNASENIAASKIKNALDRLNKDFQRLNADTNNTRSVFDSLAAGVKFEFCLASRDPNGNPTNGITRTPTNHGSFGQLDSVKHTSQGGKDAWPTDEYLNIWICPLGLLGGYASVPSDIFYSPNEEDGVVLRDINVDSSDRTITHEVGHWFNLYHVFQDSCDGSSNNDCNIYGDEVCDTPQQGGSTAGCDSTRNTCPETPEYPDMIENYMSYADCQNMFTKGQTLRMITALNAYTNRFSLKYSRGCGGPPDKGYVTSYPYDQNFENNFFPPQFWRSSFSQGKSWVEEQGIGGFGNSQQAAKARLYTPNENLNGGQFYLTTQFFDLSNVNQNLAISFSYAYAPYSQSRHDSLIVRIDTAHFGFYYEQERIWAQGGSDLATAPPTQQPFVPQANQWQRDTIYLSRDSTYFSNYSSDTLVFLFAAKAKGKGGNNIYIDDVNYHLTQDIPTKQKDRSTALADATVSPNPSDGKFHVTAPLGSAQSLQMEVINSTGERISNKNIEANGRQMRTTIDLSSYADGFYFLKLFNPASNTTITRKLHKFKSE